MSTTYCYVFYAPNCKNMPAIGENINEHLSKMKIGESIIIDSLKFTICKSTDIPDSRNKFGRMGDNIKCVSIQPFA